MGGRAGMLCAVGVLASVCATSVLLGSALAAPTTVTVDAKQPWTPTGLSVQAGQVIKVTATGRANYCGGSPDPNDTNQPQCDATPDGSVSGESHCGGPIKCAGLIGRIGEGPSFAVGSSFKGTASASGPLELGIQDFDESDSPNGVFDNNSGTYTAEVEIDPPAKIAGHVVDDDNHGVPGVKITAKGPAKLRGTTDFDGSYEIEVPKQKLGSYKVAPEEDCAKECKGGFDPRSSKVKVDAGDTGTANFTARCAGGKRSLRAGKFRPKHGLYGGEGLASVYYDCLNNEVHAARSPGELTCDEGFQNGLDLPIRGVIPVSTYGQHGFPVGREKLSGRSFKFKRSFARIGFVELPGPQVAPLTGSLRITLDGNFVGEKAVRVEFAAQGTGIRPPSRPTTAEGSGSCYQVGGPVRLNHADPAPPIFGGD